MENLEKFIKKVGILFEYCRANNIECNLDSDAYTQYDFLNYTPSQLSIVQEGKDNYAIYWNYENKYNICILYAVSYKESEYHLHNLFLEGINFYTPKNDEIESFFGKLE